MNVIIKAAIVLISNPEIVAAYGKSAHHIEDLLPEGEGDGFTLSPYIDLWALDSIVLDGI